MEAGAIAESAVSGLKVVTAFGAEQREIAKYDKKLETVEKIGIKAGILGGFFFIIIAFLFYGIYTDL